MSDSYFDHHTNGHAEPDSASFWEGGESARNSTAAGTGLVVDWHRLADWLPRLGTMLWLHRGAGDRTFPRARLLPHGVLLLDHPALAAFADCSGIGAHGAVTAQGPREWLEFHNGHGACIARLYLLPDTDYLGWDAMLAECGIARLAAPAPPRWHAHGAFMRGAFARLRSPWQARTMRFPVLRLPCLQVLGLRAPAALSALGHQLAAAIANDERAVLQSATA